MKKTLVGGIIIAAVCLGFFAGSYSQQQKNIKSREQRCSIMMGFATSKIEALKSEYDADEMEALISNIYAAYEYSNGSELSSSLHTLWNALIFDGEKLVGNEDDLISALNAADAHQIEDIAMRMRSKD